MMNREKIEFSEKVLEEYVNVITDAKFVRGSSFEGPKHLTIFFEDNSVSMSNIIMHQPRLTIEVPSPFPYMDNKMVPWNYNSNYVHEAPVVNISSIEGMTRSGKCYAPIMAKKASPKPMEEIPKQKKNQRRPRCDQGTSHRERSIEIYQA